MIVTLEELAAALAGEAPLMGLDPGTRTIGVALSDPGRRIATPLRTLRRGRKFTPDARRLLEIAESEGVGGIVIGLPVNMDGSIG
ncbi:MAG TPA: pre-16S rRNA-processing nuclease YqgF, partial [Thermopetrobacter sp.]|nr:pre-16S rRNA-processing nuclease YqgF [Thermopetrobacter sp.]